MSILENILVTAAVMFVASLFLWPQIHYARQTSLCQAAFMGVGGYAAAFLISKHGWAWMAAIPAGALVAGLTGALASAATHRVREDTFAIATLGIQLIASNAFIVAEPITGGAAGIFFLPPLFASFTHEVIYLTVVATLGLIFMWYLPRGMFGRHCRAVGDDAVLYETWGWSAGILKSVLSGLAGMGAGVSGALLVGHLGVAEPSLFSASYSIALVTIAILVPGKPLIVLPLASVVFAATPELLRFVGLDAARAAYGQQALFYGLLVVAAFRDRKDERPLPGALSSGVWTS
jgi:branched-chain amino acid transport system permease protein